MNKQHKEVLEEYLVKKEKLLTHFKKYERAFPARDIKDLSNRTKALRYAIDILGRVEDVEGLALAFKRGLAKEYKFKYVAKVNETVAEFIQSYLKGE